MEKFKRYLGLAMAIALLALAFAPFENNFHPMASKVTPLDNTVLRKLTGVGGREMTFWVYATDYMNRCTPFRNTSLRITSGYREVLCEGDDYLFSTITHEYETELLKFEPTLSILRNEYLRTPKLAKEIAPATGLSFLSNEASTNSHSIYLRSLEGPKRSTRSLQLELQIGAAMTNYLLTVRNSIAIGIYLIHALAMLIFLGLVFARESFGALLLWPFSLVVGVAKAGTKAAKSLHDKI